MSDESVNSGWKLKKYGGHKTEYNPDGSLKSDADKYEEKMNPPKNDFKPGNFTQDQLAGQRELEEERKKGVEEYYKKYPKLSDTLKKGQGPNGL